MDIVSIKADILSSLRQDISSVIREELKSAWAEDFDSLTKEIIAMKAEIASNTDAWKLNRWRPMWKLLKKGCQHGLMKLCWCKWTCKTLINKLKRTWSAGWCTRAFRIELSHSRFQTYSGGTADRLRGVGGVVPPQPDAEKTQGHTTSSKCKTTHWGRRCGHSKESLTMQDNWNTKEVWSPYSRTTQQRQLKLERPSWRSGRCCTHTQQARGGNPQVPHNMILSQYNSIAIPFYHNTWVMIQYYWDFVIC